MAKNKKILRILVTSAAAIVAVFLVVVATNYNGLKTFALSSLGQGHSVTISWTASTSKVAGYNVYGGTTSGGPYKLVNKVLVLTTSYTDTNVQSGKTYYYVVTAVNPLGIESNSSKEISATVP